MAALLRRLKLCASLGLALSLATADGPRAQAQSRPWDPRPTAEPTPAPSYVAAEPEPLPPTESIIDPSLPVAPVEPSMAELLDRVTRLESQLAEQAAVQAVAPPAPPAAAAAAPAAADACGDAVKPAAPPCDCSKCAGYDKGFYVRTVEGDFMLKVNGLLQPRYVANWRSLDAGAGDEDELGFTLARAPVIFSGNAVTPKLGYWIILQGNNASGSEFVEEARINYEFENGILMQLGRFRNPTFMRELDVSYARVMGVERSYQHAIFTTGILEGLCLSKQNDHLRGMFFVNDGRNSGAPTAGKDFFEDFSDFAVSSGLDWKLTGDWAQYGDFASWPDEPLAMFIGADVHYENGETGDSLPANDLNEFITWTVDATIERCGFMAFGSFVQRSSLVDGDDTEQNGLQALTAYQIIPDKLEPFVRYEYIDFDGVTNVGSGVTAVADSSVNIVSAGANWYIKRHAVKVTVEAKHALDPIPVAVPMTGFLVDASGEDGQTVLMTQLQLFF